jgi:hypothetical protein
MSEWSWTPPSLEDRAEFEALVRGRDVERVEEDVWGHPGVTPRIQAAAMVGHYTALMRHVANNTWHRTRDGAGDGPDDGLLLLRCMSRIGTCLHNHHTVMMSGDETGAGNLLFAMCRSMVRDLETLQIPARWHPEWTRHVRSTEPIAHRWQELCRIAAHVAGMEVHYGVPSRVLAAMPPEPVEFARWGVRARSLAAFVKEYASWFRGSGEARNPVTWHTGSIRSASDVDTSDAVDTRRTG